MEANIMVTFISDYGNRKRHTVEISNILVDDRLLKVLIGNRKLQKKWLIKMVQDDWVEIEDHWEEED
jgi:hypothetical protein